MLKPLPTSKPSLLLLVSNSRRYPKELVIVTKVGAVRGPEGSWDPARSQSAIRSQVDENLLQREGKVHHIGLSNVTAEQVEEGRAIASIVCVQKHYNLAHRTDDALIDRLATAGIAYVPLFPLGGFTPLQSATLSGVATELGVTPMQVALARLLRRAPNVLLIPGTSSREHLRENLSAAELELPAHAMNALEQI